MLNKNYTQKELTDALDYASVMYYQGKNTEFTDTEFDELLHKLQKMEEDSGIVYPNSPTQRVGSDIQDGFDKVQHPTPMLTISNTYNDDDVSKWMERFDADTLYNVGIKYDGVSCELHYVNGTLHVASTRGDKNIGDDITNNVKTIKSVPLTLYASNIPSDFYVRGEIMLPKSVLEDINVIRISAGETPFANTRNACSGSIKQLDSRVTATRGLIFRAWDCYSVENGLIDFNCGYNSMTEKVNSLENMGFVFENNIKSFKVKGSELIEQCIMFKTKLDESYLDYDYDGVVIKLDDINTQVSIGTKDTRSIEWGIARKWNEDYVVETDLINVTWQVGRTGVLTPVGQLVPVQCGGVVISNVTLNNIDFINQFDLHLGDTLKITRSGGVIPYVLGVTKRAEDGIKVTLPLVCPECGGSFVKEGVLVKCINKNCRQVLTGKIIQFCSKDCMDIKTVGDAVVDDFYNAKIVHNLTDFINLYSKYSSDVCSPNEYSRNLAKLSMTLGDGYGFKKLDKIMTALTNAKTQPYERLLASLSIPGVGKVTAKLLAKKVTFLYGFYDITWEELADIDGIGERTATLILEWFKEPENIELVDALVKNGFQWFGNVGNVCEHLNEGVLKNLTLVFTGKSFRFQGDAIETFFEDNGAKTGHSVSKKTSYLIIGDKPGNSKVKKAEELNVPILTEQEFYEKFGL